MKGVQFIPFGTNIDFWGHRWFGYGVSLFLIFASIGLLATKGLNFGIDFTGGTLIEIRTEQTVDLAQMRNELNGLDLGAISIQEFGGPQDLLLRVPEQPGDEAAQAAAIETVRTALDAAYGEVDYRRVEFVGPQVGDELKVKGVWAALFAMVGISVYIWFRFEWQFGAAALVALFHDVIVTMGFFALTGFTFDLSALAAVLTVAGYSVNDTIVIFDRVRETLRKYRKKPLVEIINRAVNDTLARTIVTGLTTILALAALAFVGGEVLRGFVLAIIFGLTVATHSSIFAAALLLMYLKIRPEKAFDSTQESAASS